MKRRGDIGKKSEQTELPVTNNKTPGPGPEESFIDEPYPDELPDKARDASQAAEADHQREEARTRQRTREAPKNVEDLTMGEGVERVITYQFRSIDTYQEYVELRESLRFKGRASALGYGELLDALDQAEENAHRGAELLARTQVTHDDFEFDAMVVESTMRRNAIEALEERKAEKRAATKLSGKAINKDDINMEIAAMFPDEFAALSSKRSEAKRHVELIENLAERLVERSKNLRAMVSKSRAVE